MLNRKVTIITIVATLAALMSILVVARSEGFHSSPSAKRESKSEPLAAEGNTRLSDSVELLGRSVAELARRIDSIETKAHGDNKGALVPSAAKDSGDPPQTAELGRERNAQARADAMDRLADIEESFRAESRDPAWSKTMQTKLESAFLEGGFDGTKLLSTDCRSTFCRMEVAHDGVENSSNFELIRRKISGSYYMQHLDPDATGKSKTVAFFVREGHERENAIQSVMAANR